jgi:putative heme-binding domain-containing protein
MKMLARYCSLLAVVTASSLLAAEAPKAKEKAAPKAAVALSANVSWIWPTKPATANQKAWFRKEFTFHKSATATARLYASADNEFRLFLNGEQVAESKEWQDPVMVNIIAKLVEGRNVLAVEAKNDGGDAAALMVKLEIVNGTQITVVGTDDSWKSAVKMPVDWQKPGFDDSAWTKPFVLAPLGGAPWTSVNEARLASLANVKPPTATPVSQLRVMKDFKVDLLYSVPKDQQGSWVSMTVDPKGRLIVCDQYGGLYRVTLPAVTSTEGLKVEKINVDIGEAQGLLWAFDSLYVVVNRGGKYPSGVYRVRDTNGDDVLDSVETLRLLNGGGEHGPHAVVLSPDGKSLYICAGNGTKFTDVNSSKVPRIWSEDHLLPRMPDGRGFMRDVMAPGGCVYRISPDGKDWELISSGYRNEYDIAFNRFGDLFTYDADMEWDFNTPWYRPTRVCLSASGGEFGWRNGAGKWPAYYPDSLGPVINIGPGSPTGIAFGYGAKFPAKYQDALFISDWSYGKLYAIHMKPDGSAYTAEKEDFITGSPLPLTDLVIHPDGCMYITIGGRKTQSGLYRVTYTGKDSTAPSKGGSAPPLLAERRKLEAFHGKVDENAVKEAWKYLSHSDRYLRFAARIAIEWQPVNSWQAKALSEKNPVAATHALLALARAGDKTVLPELLAALDRIDWSKLTDSQRTDFTRVYHVAFARMGHPDEATRQKLIAKLDPLFPAQRREVSVELAQILVYLEAPSAAKKLSDMLANAPTQEEQIDYARALRVLKTGWTMDQRKAFFSWFLKAANFKGGNSLEGFLRNIKNDAIATCSQAELAELKPILDAKPEKKSSLEMLMAGRTFVKEWTVAELGPKVEKAMKKRNFDKGRQLFGAVGCASCHRFDTEGGAVGPDLTGLGGRFSARDVLESIVDPNKEISDQFGSVVITTNDELSYSGRVVNLNGDTIMFNTDMFDPNQSVGINTKNVKSIEPSKVSMMPEGLINVLKEDEIADLLAFLMSRGDRNNAMFK